MEDSMHVTCRRPRQNFKLVISSADFKFCICLFRRVDYKTHLIRSFWVISTALATNFAKFPRHELLTVAVLPNDQQETAINVIKTASISHANRDVIAFLFVAIVARMIALVFVRLVPINARITANTVFAIKPVGIAACLVRINVTGTARITTAQNFARSHAIDQDVTNHAKKSYHATTRALVFVVRNVRSFAEFATKMLIISRGVTPKLCSWNWWTAIMCLK